MVNYSKIAGMAGYGKARMQKKKGKIVTSMSTRKPTLLMNPRGGTAEDFRAKGGRVIDKPGRVKPKVEGKPTPKSTSTSKNKKEGPLVKKAREKIASMEKAKERGLSTRFQKGTKEDLLKRAREADEKNAKKSQRMTKAQRLKMIQALRKKRKRGQR